MGNDYTTCWGGDRNQKQPRAEPLYKYMTDKWQHETNFERVRVTPEEAYMIKKQQSLNIHFIPCQKLKMRFQTVCSNSINQSISQSEFCAILAASKLLRSDFPDIDNRWKDFYSKFIVMDQTDVSQPWRKRYSLVPTQIALIFLAQGDNLMKSKAICELFSEDQFLQPSPPGIHKHNEALGGDRSYEENLQETMLSQEQLKCVISIFVNVSLVLLPIFASDFPCRDKRNYYKYLVQWTKRSQNVIDHFINEFRGGPGRSNHRGGCSMRQFIDVSVAQDIFNVLTIREVAKRTAVIQDANPDINRESALSKDLFGGRMSEQELNQGIEDDLTELPDIFSQAVLYKVVQTIDNQLSMTQRVSKREARQYLQSTKSKAINGHSKRKSRDSGFISMSDKENQNELM